MIMLSIAILFTSNLALLIYSLYKFKEELKEELEGAKDD